MIKTNPPINAVGRFAELLRELEVKRKSKIFWWFTVVAVIFVKRRSLVVFSDSAMHWQIKVRWWTL